MTASTSPRRFYLLTLPRTASNLPVKILALEDQSNLLTNERDGYFFIPTVPLRLHDPKTAGRHLDNWTTDERTQIRDSYQIAFDALRKYAETAEAQGKDTFVKEHLNWMVEPVVETKLVYGEESADEVPWTVKTNGGQTHSALNLTILPDEFLKIWLPTFSIRHPALVFSSNYRTYVNNEGKEKVKNETNLQRLEMTYHWSRTLYDWYTEQFAHSEKERSLGVAWPIILDADDIMLGPEVVMKYAKIVCLYPEKLKFSWSPKSKQEMDKVHSVERRILSTISASGGIMEGKTSKGIDMDRRWGTGRWNLERMRGARSRSGLGMLCRTTSIWKRKS